MLQVVLYILLMPLLVDDVHISCHVLLLLIRITAVQSRSQTMLFPPLSLLRRRHLSVDTERRRDREAVGREKRQRWMVL